MSHPQPAFDFLVGLPVDASVDEYLLMDWWADDDIDAESGDDIVNHPEVWNVLELPDALAELSPDDHVSIQPISGHLNLNAAAIGLGLENVRYSPELFSGLVYCPNGYDATAILCWENILFTVGETAEDVSDLVKYTTEMIEELGLAEPEMFDEDIQTGSVVEFSSTR